MVERLALSASAHQRSWAMIMKRPYNVRICHTALVVLTIVLPCAAQEQPQWIPMGPAPEGFTDIGVEGGVSGRVWSMAFSANYDHQGTQAMYIGVGGGGVWRSTDFAQKDPHWTPLTDHLPGTFPLDRLGALQNIGAMAVDPLHPWIIYAGSGDPVGSNGNAYGRGILRSEDGGGTWTLSGIAPDPFGPGFSRIFVDPTDATGHTIYAVTHFGPNSPLRGIFKSVDSGTIWTNIQTGIPANVAITDLDYTVNDNALTLYAGLTSLSAASGGSNGIWKSTTGGTQWAQMFMVPIKDMKGATLPAPSIGVVRLAADHAPGAPNGVFAAVCNSPKAELMNVFRLNQRTWVPTAGNMSGVISTYAALAFGMSETGALYVGMGNDQQDGMYQSVDAGANWSTVFNGASGGHPHHDQRCWGFWGGMVFEGNDGGIVRFVPQANGAAGPGAWESLNTASLQTILAYGVGIHPNNPKVMLVGCQDNATARRMNDAWNYVTGADDATCEFDPFDANYAYRTGVSDPDFFFRSRDGASTWPDHRNVVGSKAIPMYAKYGFHPTVAGRMVLGLDTVFETMDRADHWRPISDALAGLGVPATAVAYGGGNVLFAAYNWRLFRTDEAGVGSSTPHWPEIAAGNNWKGNIISIQVDPTNSARVYLAVDGGAIWRSTDGGVGWEDITGDLPGSMIGVNALTLRTPRPGVEPTLYAGTNIGVYSTSTQSGTRHWERAGDDFPNVNVTDLEFNNTNKCLTAATYGRGVFSAYLHFISDVAPGATTINSTVFNLSKDPDGRVCVNQAEFGHAFSGWFELQGGGRTNDAPAGATVDKSIFVFIRGLDDHIYLNQAEFGHAFSGWFEVQGDGLTDASPSAATIDKTVFVFVKGLNNHVFLNQADFGHAFGNWFEVQGGGLTDRAPSAATLQKTVFVFIKGLDGHIYLNQADFGHAFGNWFEVQGGGVTDEAPAATTIGNSVFVFIKGMDDKIYLNQAEFGHAFSGWFEVQGGGLTDDAPVATTVGNSVFVFIKGLDGHIYLNQAEFGHAFSGWFEVGGGL